MISEGPCDTEDWSNDAENSVLITEMLHIIYIQIENSYLIFVIQFDNTTVFTLFSIKLMQLWWAEETSFKTLCKQTVIIQNLTDCVYLKKPVIQKTKIYLNILLQLSIL